MPNKLMEWDMANKSGNPTKAVIANALIKHVKQQEVRKLRKASRAVLVQEIGTFAELIEKCRSRPSGHRGYRTGATYFIFQLHMIARLDDIMNFKLKDLTTNIKHSDAIKPKMRWSKNVLEEREYTDQIILESMDWKYCILV